MRCEYWVMLVFLFNGCISSYIKHNLVDLVHVPSAFEENATAEAVQKFKSIVLKQQKFSVMQQVIDSKSAANEISSQSDDEIIMQQTIDAIYKAFNFSDDNYRVLEEIEEILKVNCLLCENINSTPIEYLLTALIYIELANDPNYLGKGVSKETTWWTNYFLNSGNMPNIILKILEYIRKYKCHGDFKMDLWFLLDGMESTTEDQFQSSLNFTSSLASKFNVTKEKVQVGCSLSSHEILVPQFLNDTTNAQDFQQVVSGITKPTTHVESYSETVDDVLDYGFGSLSGARTDQSDVYQTLIFFNDEQSIGGGYNPIENIQGFNVTVFEFLIGRDLNESEISCLSGNSNDEKCNFVSSYYDLADEKYQDLLTKEYCSFSEEEKDVICVVACDNYVEGEENADSADDVQNGLPFDREGMREALRDEYEFDCSVCRNYSQEERNRIYEENVQAAVDNPTGRSRIMEIVVGFMSVLVEDDPAANPPASSTTAANNDAASDNQNTSSQNSTKCADQIKSDVWLVVNLLKDTDDMEFQTLMDYIANITEKLQISPEYVQIGLSFYSFFQPARHYSYQDCGSRESFTNVLNYRETPPSRPSMFQQTVDYTLKTCFNESAGARPLTDYASRHIVLLTDGNTADEKFLNKSYAQESNVTVTAISVGNNGSTVIDDDENTFKLNTYADLDSSFVEKVFETLCHLKNGSGNIATEGGRKKDLQDVIKKYEDFHLNFTKNASGKAILYLKISSPTNSSVSLNYRIVLDSLRTGVLISPEELIKRFPELQGEEIVVSYSIVSSEDVIVNKSRKIEENNVEKLLQDLAAVARECENATADNDACTKRLREMLKLVEDIDTELLDDSTLSVIRQETEKIQQIEEQMNLPATQSQCLPSDPFCRPRPSRTDASNPDLTTSSQNTTTSVSTEQLGSTGFQSGGGNWLIYVVMVILLLFLMMCGCVTGAIKKRKRKVEPDVENPTPTEDDLESLIAEAKVNTSALLLKKLQEKLKSDSSFELKPDQLKEAYDVLQDLKGRIDQITSDLKTQLKKVKWPTFEDSCVEDFEKQIAFARNSDLSPALLAESEEALARLKKQVKVLDGLKSLTEKAKDCGLSDPERRELKSGIDEAQNLHIPFPFYREPRQKLMMCEKKAEIIGELEAAVVEANSSPESLSALKQLQVKAISAEAHNLPKEKATMLQEALDTSKAKLVENGKDHQAELLKSLKEATDCVKDPLATVNSFNNLKAELALAEAFGVSQENLEESYQALNNMQDNIDKVKQNLIEATENCKNPGAKFEDLKKLESALDEANNLDISSVDTCEGYGVAEDMKNRIEDEKAHLEQAIKEASFPSDFAGCIETLQKRIDAIEAFDLPEDQLKMAYTSMNALKERIDRTRNNLHENSKNCKDLNANVNDLLKLQNSLKSAENLNFPLVELIDSYETAKTLQGRIIAVGTPEAIPEKKASSDDKLGQQESAVSDDVTLGAEVKISDTIFSKTGNISEEDLDRHTDDGSLNGQFDTLLPSVVDFSNQTFKYTELESPQKSRSNTTVHSEKSLSSLDERSKASAKESLSSTKLEEVITVKSEASATKSLTSEAKSETSGAEFEASPVISRMSAVKSQASATKSERSVTKSAVQSEMSVAESEVSARASANRSETSVSKSETSIAKSERTVAKSETSPAKSETSAATSKASIATSEASAAISRVSVAESETIVAKSQTSNDLSEVSAVKSEASSKESETSAAKTETSAAKSEENIPKSEKSVAESKASAAESKASVAVSEASAAKSEVSSVKSEASAAQSEVSAAKSDVSAVESETSAKSAVSVVKSEASAVKSEASAAKSEVSAVESRKSAAKSETSTAQSEMSAVKSEASVAKSETSVAKSEASIAKSEVSAVKSEVSVAKSEVSAAKFEVRAAKSEVSIAKSKASAAESEASVVRSEASAASKKSASDDHPEDAVEIDAVCKVAAPCDDEPIPDVSDQENLLVETRDVDRNSINDVEDQKADDEVETIENDEVKDSKSVQETEDEPENDVRGPQECQSAVEIDQPASEANSVHDEPEEESYEDEFVEEPDIDVSKETMVQIRSALRTALSKMDLSNVNLNDLIADVESKFGKLSSKDIKFIEIDIERYIVLLGLQRSVGMRNDKMLRSALARKDYAMENKLKGYNLAKDKELTELINKANDLLLLFEQVERMKSVVMQLKQPTISEVRSYSHPPPAIRNVMEATFILLGENKSAMKSWDGVKKLIGKSGKQALKRRIWERDLEEIRIQEAEDADSLIVNFRKEDVEVISKAASVFYSWSKCVIQEARDRRAFKATATALNLAPET